MKIVLISDTHTKHRKLNMPDGDILIHAGDITNRGSLIEVADFNNWLGELPYKYSIVIPGNHEIGFSNLPMIQKKEIFSNAIYLEDSQIEIEGLKFFGSGFTKWFLSWEFNLPRYEPEYEKRATEIWGAIPDDTHVLITHGLPYGILDKVNNPGTRKDPHVGCKYLLNRVNELKMLKLHIGGHIHESRGVTKINNITFINAATLDENYEIVREPIVIDV